MKKKMCLNNSLPIVFASILAISFFFLKMRPGDDLVFNEALNKKDWYSYGVIFYNTWGGRYLMAFAFPSLISNNGLVFLKILYAVSSIIFTYSSINIVQFFAGKKLDFLQQFVFLTAFFCLYKPIFNSAVLWLTGAFNFFLPFAFVLCVVAIILNSYGKEVSLPNRFYCLVCTFIACSFEQTSILLLVSLFLILLIYKRVVSRQFIVFLIVFACICSFVLFVAAGNRARFTSEALSWYPDFNEVSFFKKIYDIILLSFESVISFNWRYYTLLCMALILLYSEKWRLSKLDFIKSLLVLSAPLLVHSMILHGLGAHPPYEQRLEKEVITHYNEFFLQQFLSIGLTFFIFFLISLYALKYDKFFFYKFISIILVCSTTFALMSMSPTVYASGYRTHFIFSMGLWISFGMIVGKISKRRYLNVLALLVVLFLGTQLDKF